MGFSASWIAVRGKSPDTVLQELRLRPTGVREEFPESPISAAELPGGWFLIYGTRCDFAQSLPLSTVSLGAEVVTCDVEEHVMASGASGLRDGALLWSVTHDFQQGQDDLNVSGQMPTIFASIHQRLMAEQRKNGARERVDYVFDIPVELAAALTGFRHDMFNPPNGEEPFEVLAQRWQL